MNEIILGIWIAIWVIFLAISTIEKRGIVFGFMSGLWFLLLGVFIYLDGLQYQSGMTITTNGAVETVQFVYTTVVPPNPMLSLQTLWCVPFFLIGIYLMYLAVFRPQ